MSSSSSSNSDHFTSSSSGEDQDDLVLFQMMTTMASNTNDLFNSHEMEEGGGVNLWTQPLVSMMFWVQATPALFKL
jgi:hypothetical protein